MNDATKLKSDEINEQNKVLPMGIVNVRDNIPASRTNYGQSQGGTADDGSSLTQKVPNNSSAADENEDRWNELIKIKQGSNGQFYLDIDPNLLSEHVVKKFWRENASKVGEQIDLNIFQKMIEMFKALINKIVKFVTGNEGPFSMRDTQPTRIQNPSLAGAMHLRSMLVNEIKEQAGSLTKSLESLGIPGSKLTSDQMSKISDKLDKKLNLMEQEKVTVDFTDMGHTEVFAYIEALEEYQKREVSADKAVVKELMTDKNAFRLLMEDHPSVFEGKSKAVTQALNDIVGGGEKTMSKAVLKEVQKLTMVAYALQDFAEKTGTAKRSLYEIYGEDKNKGLADAIGIREALKVSGARFTAENINLLEIKMSQEPEMFNEGHFEKVREARSRADLPHFISSQEEDRWFQRRKQDLLDGVTIIQSFSQGKQEVKDKVLVSDQPVEAQSLAQESEVKVGIELPEIPRPVIIDDLHRLKFDQYIAEDNAIAAVLAASDDEKRQLFESIKREAYIMNGLKVDLDPFEVELSDDLEKRREQIDKMQAVLRNAFAGPGANSDGKNGLNRSDYELFVYKAGMAIIQDVNKDVLSHDRDYVSEYEEERSVTSENDKSYRARATLTL